MSGLEILLYVLCVVVCVLVVIVIALISDYREFQKEFYGLEFYVARSVNEILEQQQETEKERARRMGKYTDDKKRIDEYEEKIANQEPVKEWAVIYWMLVAIGHLLEWVVKHEH